MDPRSEKSDQPTPGEKPPAAGVKISGDTFTRRAEGPPIKKGTGQIGVDSYRRGSEELAAEKPASAKEHARTLIAPEALRTLTESTLAKAQPLVEGLEPRVELLMRACQAAELPVPGVAIGEFKHALTPNAQKIVSYLQRALKARVGLARVVQVSIFRFHEAGSSVSRSRTALDADTLDTALLEELKLKFFYLSNYHEEFKGDPILTQLFPPPKSVAPTQSLGRLNTAPLSPLEFQKQKQTRDQAVVMAERLVAVLGPRLGNAKLTMSLVDRSASQQLKALFNPAERRALNLSKRLRDDPMATIHLKKGLALFEQLAAQLKKTREGGDTEHLKQIFAYAGEALTLWLRHPLLKELLDDEARDAIGVIAPKDDEGSPGS